MCLLLFLNFSAFPKILIFTYSYNRPDFIEIQYRTFKKFLKDDYEFIVFNDASSDEMAQQIINTCKKYGIHCIRIPQEIHKRPYLQRWPGEDYNHPTIRNCNVVQYSLDNLGFFHDDIVMILDSDLFLIKEFSIKDYLNSHDIGGVLQLRYKDGAPSIRYLWIGLAFLNMATMPNKYTINFNCGRVDGIPVDAGGQTHYYLQDNPTAKVNYFNQMLFDDLKCDFCKQNQYTSCLQIAIILKELGLSDPLITLVQTGVSMEIFLDAHFIHYRGGSNWDYQSPNFHANKTKYLQEFIQKIL